MSDHTARNAPPRSGADATTRAAGLISDLFSPGYLVIAVLLLVCCRSAPSGPRGLGWGLLAAVFCGLVPLAVIHAGVRSGHLTDRHVRVREQRIKPLCIALASVLTFFALLVVFDAPDDVFSVTVSMLAALLATLVVTMWWQISVHSAVATAAVVIATASCGRWLLVTAPLIVAVAWSRLVLRAHTLAQVCCGALLGLVTSLLFAALR
ncbi:hypothetical protein ABZ614_11550 [Streptomyces sp. NPDC013178]|uniref:hypothetical protein n=1 Tax=Streptomyces sp. NPDC013178 TaxID=3155118 RepID=UPI00340328FC